MQSFYQFEDYRELLAALIADRKKNKKVFSYRWFSQRAGLSSPNFLNLVVKKKRHLSTETIEKVVEIFQLNHQEAEFFRYLTHFNKSKTLSEREHYAHELTKLKKFQNEFPLSREQFEYYSKWYHIPIREILSLENPPQSEEEIVELMTPSVSKNNVETALLKLEGLGLIDTNRKVLQESVGTGHRFSSFGVVQFHKQMLGLAAEALDRFSVQEREVSAVTVGLSEKSFQRIQKMIEDLRSQIMAIAEEDRSKQRVYQINFQAFPLSKKRRSKK